MEKTTIIAIVLGVLVLISAIQAFQLNGLKEKISDGGQLTTSSLNSNTPTTTGAAKRTTTLPSNVKNLPQMVGGC